MKPITNGEKFKTAKERRMAYSRYSVNCLRYKYSTAIMDEFAWLEHEYLEHEYEEKLKSCPFCGGSASLLSGTEDHYVVCRNDDCAAAHVARSFSSAEEAIAAWNRREK